MENSVLNWLDCTAKLYNDKIMFQDTKASLTFGEFNAVTKSIGTNLLNKINFEEPVAVMCSRSVYAPASYLGVTRAGGIYAPMDGTMPVKRLNNILSVISAKYILTDRVNLPIAQKLNFIGEIFVLEDIVEAPADEDALARVAKNVTANTPLYIIFTSGSSGTPKAVVTSHNALMCYIDAFCEMLKVTHNDVLGNQSPLDYIASIRDIFIPVKIGASTVIIPKNEFAIPKSLFSTLNEYKVTTICWSVAGMEIPARLNAFAIEKPRWINKVVFSGSVMNGKYLKQWQENLPNARFINQYGPTEATASCTYYEVNERVKENTLLPIGKAYKNYNVFLLNKDNTLTEKGQVGEICVSGPCLALGYYGNRELTEKAFVQNPLNNSYKELIYKTGDLGRMSPSGDFEYIGRIDRQIKHIGHRIELEEIEKVALDFQGVTASAVVYCKEKSTLWLFYTGSAQMKDLVLYFREVLPAFMVPRKVVKRQEMPLLPNGKIDYNTLNTYTEKGM